MMMDTTLSALAQLPQIDPHPLDGGINDAAKIKQVSKAMEGIFTGQLMAELNKSIDGDDSEEKSPYSDFIQQGMTQGIEKGGGLGLAKTIESYLNHRNEKMSGHMPLKTPNNSYHVNRAD